MSAKKQIERDGLLMWADTFMKRIRYDYFNMTEAKSICNTVLKGEKEIGPVMAEMHNIPTEERLIRAGLAQCHLWRLPITRAALGILLLGCDSENGVRNEHRQMMMNTAIAKCQYELLKDTLLHEEGQAPLADARFVMGVFGRGTFDRVFYQDMWSLQVSLSDDGIKNLLENVTADDFEQSLALVV